MKRLINFLSLRLNFSHKGIEKYLKNTLWLFGEKSATMFLGLFVGIAVARYLGPSDFGIISYGLTMLTIATGSAALGIDDLIIRDAIKNPADSGKIFGTAFACRTLAAFIFFVICASFAFFTTEQGSFIPVVIVAASTLVQPVGVLSLFFQMKVNARPMVVANIYGHVISAGLKIALILMNAPVVYFALAMFMDYFIAMTLATIFYIKNGYSFKEWKFDKNTAVYFFKKGWPLAIVAILGIVYTKIDMVALNILEGKEALGIYAVSVRLTEVWFEIPAALAASLFPAIINAKQNENEYLSRIFKVLSIMSIGSICMGLFVTFGAGLIISILYGTKYIDATESLSIYIWKLFFISMNVITIKWLMAEDHIILNMYRTIASVIINIVLSYLLITKYGITGAAVASVLSCAFFAYFIDIFSKKTRGLFIIKTRAIFFPITYIYGVLAKKQR